jgi:acyl-CoA thioesterase-1
MSGAARLLAACLSAFLIYSGSADARPKRVLIFGDSLTSGFNLPEGAGFAWALRKHLYRRGHGDVLVMNSSRAGDTTDVGVDRIPLAFSGGADLVILELGGNDMLGGEDPQRVYRNLDTIVRHSKARGARVIVAGMVSTPKRDPTYKPRFDAIYPTLSAQAGVPLYPFFLDGAFGDPRFMQSDGKHPNAAGADLIAAKIAPLVSRELNALDGQGPGAARRSYYARAPRW